MLHTTCHRGTMAVTRVAVVGSGPAGLAAAQYIQAEKAFAQIQVFEQQATVGGLWNYGANLASSKVEALAMQSQADIDRPQRTQGFCSPIYDNLESNIPHNLMQYSDFPFPPGTALLPKHDVVAAYLQAYAAPVHHLVRFNAQVLDIRPKYSGSTSVWTVTSQDLCTQKCTKEEFDAVIVANGHYQKPFTPAIKGMKRWNNLSPGSIVHSQAYKKAEAYKDKLPESSHIGNSASGVEIGAQVINHCALPVLVSERSAGYLSPPASPHRRVFGEVAELLADQRAVRFLDGHIEKDIDSIILCTGYLYSFPFLTVFPNLTDGLHLRSLYKDIFYINNPTLAFVGLPLKVFTFPLAESQSAVIARVWSGRLALPNGAIMKDWEKTAITERGLGKKFHNFNYPLDAEYINELHDWCIAAKLRGHLANGGRGRMPPYWGEKERWIRQQLMSIKTAFLGKGEARHQINTMEALGFDFQKRKLEDEG